MKIAVSISLIFFLFVSVSYGEAQIPETVKGPENPWTLSLYFENDLFFGTDQNYTNGVKATWISPDLAKYGEAGKLPSWSVPVIEKLRLINQEGRMHNLSFSIGQAMYTPGDTTREDLIVNDRPYAGWLYFGVGFHSKNERRLDTLEIQAGVVGPLSVAEYTQKAIHSLRGFSIPQGWDNQLSNEPGLNLFYTRKWRLYETGVGERRLGFDLFALLGGALGNVATYANAGGEARFGWNIPADFGDSIIAAAGSSPDPVNAKDPRLSGKWGFGLYLYGTLDSRAVLRDIFLDGNTLAGSHSVDKEHFVTDSAIGVGVIFSRFKLNLARVLRTKEFKSQRENQEFGSITLSFTY